MSSLARRIQKRQFKNKLPIVSDEGKVVGQKWPVAKGQVLFLQDGTPAFRDTQHPTLSPVLQAL